MCQLNDNLLNKLERLQTDIEVLVHKVDIINERTGFALETLDMMLRNQDKKLIAIKDSICSLIDIFISVTKK